jgi:hypothetical protein
MATDLGNMLKTNNLTSVKVIRNTSYIFKDGACIARHDKTAPHNETRRVIFGNCISEEKNTLYQPGNKKGNASLINSTIGLEICYEHVHGVLKRECTKSNKAVAQPLMHFIISQITRIHPNNIHGDYLITVGTGGHPQIQRINPKASPVVLYRAHAFFQEEQKLTKVQPQIVIEKRQLGYGKV